MKKFLVGLILGIFIGYITVGLLQASDSGDARTYKELLRRLISLVEQVQITSKVTADNTTAMRKKMGAS
jgi:hypothetical protein